MKKRNLNETLRIQTQIDVFIKKQQTKTKQTSTNGIPTNMKHLGFGLIFGCQKSSKMETFWKREKVDFLLKKNYEIEPSGGPTVDQNQV